MSYTVLVKWTGHRAAVQPGETVSGFGALADPDAAWRAADVYRWRGHRARVVDSRGRPVPRSVSRVPPASDALPGQLALFGGGR